MQTGKIELQALATLKDGSGSAGTSGQVLSSTSTGTAWITPIANVAGTNVVTSIEVVSAIPDVGARVSGRLYFLIG